LTASQESAIKLLNKLPVSTIAQFSKLSKGYISQVKSGLRPPSEKLISALEEYAKLKRPQTDHTRLFLQSREAMGCSDKTLAFYRSMLSHYNAPVNYAKATQRTIERFLNNIPASNNNLSTRHAYYRTLEAFHNWLQLEFGMENPTTGLQAPILSKPVLPTLTDKQVLMLIEKSESTRDKAILALFTESGLRLSELAAIEPQHINWENRTIRVFGKGRKEAYAPFGQLTEQHLKEWLTKYKPTGNVWGITKWGIVLMLRRLESKTRLPCNPHTFRHTFACLLRKAGVDSMTIKDLGRWESLEMVQRYTKSVTFQDSLKFYKSPLR